MAPNRLELEPLHRLLNVPHIAGGRLEVLGAALACDFEAEDFGLVVVDLGGQNDRHGVVHEEHLGEAGAEAGTVHVDLAGLGQVDLFAPWAVVLEPARLEGVGEADRHHLLAIAKGPRARPVNSIEELLVNFGEATRRQDVASMDQTIEVARLLV